MATPAPSRLVTVTAFAALVVAIELCIPRLYAALPAPIRQLDDRIRQREMLMAMPEQADALLLGDSAGAQSMFPPTFDRLTGLHSINLATFGNMSPVSDVYFFRSYLEHHQPPEAIFFAQSMHSWRQDPDGQLFLRYFPRRDLAFDLLHLGVISPLDALHAIVRSTVPSLRYRTKFSEAFDVVRGHGWLRASPGFEEESLYLLRLKGGYFGAEGKFAGMTPDALDAVHALQRDGDTVISPSRVAMIKALCREARSVGAVPFVISAPYVSSLEEYPEVRAALDDIAELMKNGFDGKTDCITFDPHNPLDPRFMQDTTHTNNTGAIIFTNGAAKIWSQMAQ